ncbi:unnamed protein product [Didymodactylos carnosus]|uniref:Uncharacterized protein n=2 Tax=Didymodactylos carnosus TaxID=1234261 RepID=A0A815WL01_9BILA|nr:unnamed protein product [Didymodactylos carnosus]CAF4402649.1 unnamed protein product [Didymodactylos carnosus]
MDADDLEEALKIAKGKKRKMLDHYLQSRRMQRSNDDIILNNDAAQSSLSFLPHVMNNVPYGVSLLESTLFLVPIYEQNSDTDSEYELLKVENDSSMRDEINSGTGENLEIDDENIISNNVERKRSTTKKFI